MLACLSQDDFVQAFIRSDGSKRGKWSSARNILSIDRASWTASLPGSLGRTFKAALEDIFPAITDDSFALLVRQANDLYLREHLNFIDLNPSVDDLNSSHNYPSIATATPNRSIASSLAPPPSLCPIPISLDVRHHPLHLPLAFESPSTGPSIANSTQERSLTFLTMATGW